MGIKECAVEIPHNYEAIAPDDFIGWTAVSAHEGGRVLWIY